MRKIRTDGIRSFFAGFRDVLASVDTVLDKLDDLPDIDSILEGLSPDAQEGGQDAPPVDPPPAHTLTRADAARTLGVRPSASRAEVTRAFRARARRHHPDHGGDASAFAALVAARDRLLSRDP